MEVEGQDTAVHGEIKTNRKSIRKLSLLVRGCIIALVVLFLFCFLNTLILLTSGTFSFGIIFCTAGIIIVALGYYGVEKKKPRYIAIYVVADLVLLVCEVLSAGYLIILFISILFGWINVASKTSALLLTASETVIVLLAVALLAVSGVASFQLRKLLIARNYTVIELDDNEGTFGLEQNLPYTSPEATERG